MTESLPIILLVLLVVMLALGVAAGLLSRFRAGPDPRRGNARKPRAKPPMRGPAATRWALKSRASNPISGRTSPTRARSRPAPQPDCATRWAERSASFREATQAQLTDMAGLQQRQLQGFGEQLAKLTLSNEQRLEAVRVTVEQRLDAMRIDNAAKLEQMRATVDEKLQATLEQRLGESFKMVSDRLEQVHRGLGEMQSLATGVGDLKRVLSNVKTRGMWGEVQLGDAALGSPRAAAVRDQRRDRSPHSNKRVEFAIRLPGRGDDGRPCWLPVDAKFPLEDVAAAAGRAGARGRSARRTRPRSSLARASAREAKTIPTNYIRRRSRPTSRSCSCRPKACTPR